MSEVVVTECEVRPTCWGSLPEDDRDLWSLYLFDGMRWGWSICERRGGQGRTMNRKGEWILESRHSESNKFRRWSFDEAQEIALKYVDKRKVYGRTASEWVAEMVKEK